MEQKSPDAFRTISEVAEWLGVPTHVLRFWESRFTQVKPVKRAGGRRYYRPSDMELLGGIRKLLHEDGMTIRGVQKLLREEGVKHVAAMSPALDLDAEGDGASNVVSLSARSRANEADVEDAEVVAEDEGTLPVDEAMEDGAVTPVDPEEDRPVSFGTDEDAGPAEVETDAPTLSDEVIAQADAPQPEDDSADDSEDANLFADPLVTAQPVDAVNDDAMVDETTQDDDWAEEETADAAMGEEDDAPQVEMVTSGALPGNDDPWALSSDEPVTPASDPSDEAEEDTPAWNPAVEVSGADDSDIVAPTEDTPPHTEDPHISRADPEPEEHAHEVEAAPLDDDDLAPDAPTYADMEDPAAVPTAADPTGDDPARDVAAEADDTPSDPAPTWSDDTDIPVDAGYSDYAPVLVMPDIDDDPADGTLPPDIAPVGPRLRRLRARGLTLPPAHLSALSDRLKTLGSDPSDGALR